MPLFRKKIPTGPVVQDQALRELAQMFLYYVDDPTPGSEFMNASRFDFSIESLKALDEHLERVRRMSLSDEAHAKIVMRAGAYSGEVVRRHCRPRELHWLTYADAAKISPTVASHRMGIPVAAVLWDGSDGFTFPLARIDKYLREGGDQSVWSFASAMLAA